MSKDKKKNNTKKDDLANLSNQELEGKFVCGVSNQPQKGEEATDITTSQKPNEISVPQKDNEVSTAFRNSDNESLTATQADSEKTSTLKTDNELSSVPHNGFSNNHTVDTPAVLKKSSKRKILSTVFLLLMCAAGIYVMFQLGETFSQGDSATFSQILSQMNFGFFGLAIAVLLIMILADMLKYLVVAHAATGRAKLLTSLKVSLLGKYYDNITPFAIGGQPFQIFYINKKGYSGGEASAIVLIKYFFQMFSWLIVALVLMAFNAKALEGLNRAIVVGVKIGAWIGFAVNSMPTLFILLFCIVPNFADKILCGVISLGFKLKIVKDKQKYIDKAHKVATDFVSCFKIMAKTPLRFVLLILLCLIEPISMLSFPYFLVVSIANQAPSFQLWFDVITLNMFAMYSVAIFPTPGNSGFFETTFSLVFSGVATDVLFWVTLSWRFFTYYIYILIGIIISLYAAIRSAVRLAREKSSQKRVKKE